MYSPQTTESIDLFLVGKTGHGKSSTGNTILGSERFKDSDSGESATFDTALGWGYVGDTLVKVVDGPGLVDTRKDGEGQKRQAEDKLGSGFIHCPNGFHAFLLVLTYGSRFTGEEEKTVDILRSIFGDKFVKHHCILIFTHDENFDLQQQKTPEKTFEGWLEEQTGELGKLIKECGNRAVLFYNLIEDKRSETLKALFLYGREIKERYTHEMFKQVMSQRKELIESSGAIQLKENIQRDINLVTGMLGPDAGEPNKNRLDTHLKQLEENLSKENPQLESVQSLELAIERAKNGKYSKARASS